MSYTIQHIAEILNATASLQISDAVVEHLVTDSRRVSFPATSLFFALQTERRDGLIFIKEVHDRGLRNFIVKTGYDAHELPDANFIFVDNTLLALQQLAAFHRSQFNYPVVGITGSNGKTIVKEWLYQLLLQDYNIVRSPRSYNSQIGVPLGVWQMGAESNLGIFEAGISRPGEMEALEKIIQPTIGILTNIGEAHGENFKDAFEKATEKVKLFSHAGVIVYCSDEAVITSALSGFSEERLFTWGKNNNADLQVTAIEKRDEATIITARFHGTTFKFTIPFSDDASIANAITCACVLLYFSVPFNTIENRMLQLQAVDMRLQLRHAINNCAVINDSYSFDITSFSIALDFLVQQQQLTQKTVIISDIPAAKNGALYQQVIDMLHTRNIERVITVGEQWNNYQSLLKNKIAVTQHYNSTASFTAHFSANHFRNEVILLKGARIFGFEKIMQLLEKKVHQTLMEINLTAIAHNLNEYRSRLQKGVKLMAMVKAFAYGSGSAEVANLLQFHKADYLGVAYADEGVELRKAGISLPIMVMNIDEAAFETMVQHSLEPELFSLNIFKAFDTFLQRQGILKYPVHIKLDTGMHRLGFEEKDMAALIQLLQNNQHIVVQSVFSHLAASEDPGEDAFTYHQAKVFENCCGQLQQVLGYNFIKHLSNSAAIFRNTSLQYDMVRLGIGLYGVDSANEQQLTLIPAGTLKTTIAQIRNVNAGDTIGYNRRGKVTRDSVIATIRIGYADGFSRRLGNGVGKVYIDGNMAPIIGSVCMDMTMINITDLPNVQEGDEVEIFGMHIPVQDVAKWCGTIPYEILTGISQRVKRVYVEE
ncbi:MAG: bifunctional UDP-N-acetylmuramoyl-tripeptide:D-alanyl-D-alanine ligase/alanine racemase [Panacibacter sp.]